jgi:diguanylate cyclase (GGDEF)-like protein
LLGGAVALVLHRRQSALKLTFNIAQWWLETVAAVLVWHAVVGGGGAMSERGRLATVVAVLVVDALSAMSIWCAIRLRTPSTSVTALWSSCWTGAITAVVNTCLALVAVDVVTVDWSGSWTLLVVATLLFAAHRAHTRLRQRHQMLEQLRRFTESVGTELRLDVIVGEILRQVRAMLRADRADLTLDAIFADADLAYAVDDVGLSTCPPRPSAAPPIRTRRGGLRIGRRADDALCAPIFVRGVEIGRVAVVGRAGDVGRFEVDDLDLLLALAGHAGIALDNARLADRLRAQVADNAHQATHDPLTGLPNRLLFERVVSGSLTAGRGGAVLLLDLDRFKEVNDALGHGVGDDLLREVAARLTAVVPDGATVARLGGDEFGIVVPRASAAQGHRVAADVRAALERPHRLSDVDVTVDGSVGIAVAGRTDVAATDMLRRADVAMYAAKAARTGVEVYTADRDTNSSARLALVTDLRRAIESGELRLAYQPKARLGDGEVVAVEALVRWAHPERGLVPPDEFVPVAEQTGLIGPLTDWVVTEAARQVTRWRELGLDLDLAVNLSPRTLLDDQLPGRLTASLTAAGVDPRRVTLEVTEGAIMADPERAIAMLAELRRHGLRLSIDDLGVGQSSLAYLKRLPVHEVKLDKSFVVGMATDAQDDAIVCSMVDLVHRLGLSCVAEGVEDAETWRRLGAIGCDVAQGYWLSRPLPGDLLAPWALARSRRSRRQTHVAV